MATDISERALSLARANAALNGLAGRVEFRLGNLFEPVAGEAFDLVLSNPPFVITPRGDESVPRYDYRDAGMSGDELVREVVIEGAAMLQPGGTLLCLANWESRWGENGLARVGDWVAEAARSGAPLAAWIIERDRIPPSRYAETWARDGGARPGGPEFAALLLAWLRDFEARRVVSVGLGSIRVQRIAASASAEAPVMRAEHVEQPFAEAPGAALESAMAVGVATARMSDDQVLALRWVRDEAVVETREHRPGEESPRSISLRTARPIGRSVVADTLLAAAVGACDGELTLGQIADALATLLEAEAEACAAALVSSARELAWLGMLAPAAD